MMQTVERVGPEKVAGDAVPVLFLAHNERRLLPDFLRHYRSFGNVTFLAIDDGSDDGTREYLLEQPDVTVFAPAQGTAYATHKVDWRREVLDAYGTGKWCLVPDVDEHFIHVETSFDAMLDKLDGEGAEVLLTVMVDMYADRPLRDQPMPEEGQRLTDLFPYFDGPRAMPGYVLRPAGKKKLQQHPTPTVKIFGGMRERVFNIAQKELGWLDRFAMQYFAIDKDPSWSGPMRIVSKALSKRINGVVADAQKMNKVGLLKWRRGGQFSGGPHAIDQKLAESSGRAAFLHFTFAGGEQALRYTAERGSHYEGGRYYKRMLDAEDTMSRSPVIAESVRYDGPSALTGIIKQIT
ncbi:glycosyltransferase family 2 protein [Palleronia caenipelagi]|uniref:Glycosyltransferase family 2 protein n=1 Tax=Palleronia caenipelagi TaxID=2489174 RepID=A0A547QB06_9RHOB|nr:glycosyltransferase family 2 protein [Palleronia caenipelagi]TRD23564.1 glycosyltransferase family 2 protein [Palleronia caenipelagi]